MRRTTPLASLLLGLMLFIERSSAGRAATKTAAPPQPPAGPAAIKTAGAPESTAAGPASSVVAGDEPGSAPPPELLKEIEQSRAEEARLQSAKSAAQAHPEEVRYQIDYLTALIDLERTADALEAAPAIVRAFPRSAEAFTIFGRALIKDGSFDLARLQFQRALSIDESNVVATMGAGRIDFMRGDLKSAEALFRKALTLDPSRKDTRAALSSLLEKTGLYAEALSLLLPDGVKAEKVELSGRKALLREFAKQAPMILPADFTSVIVPLKTSKNLPPRVSVKVGETEERIFVIDTSAEETVLTQESARAFGLADKGKETVRDEQGREYPTSAYQVLGKLSIGPMTIQRVPVRVAPGLRYPDPRVAGAFGRDFLRRFRVALDYPARTLTLERAEGPPLEGFPFDVAGGILVDGSSGDHPAGKFQLDTSFYTPGGLDYRFVAARTGLVLGAEGVVPLPEGRDLFNFTMPDLTIASVEFRSFPATSVDLRMLCRRLGIDVRGVIGNSFLRQCRLELDFKNQWFALQRTQTSPAPAGDEK
jgi:tetratricopeptide (TPR) repeat protein